MNESNMILIGKGPIDGAWRGQYLKCPLCGNFVEKAKFNECSCGNIVMDGDMCRVTIEKSSEEEIEQYQLRKSG